MEFFYRQHFFLLHWRDVCEACHQLQSGGTDERHSALPAYRISHGNYSLFNQLATYQQVDSINYSNLSGSNFLLFNLLSDRLCNCKRIIFKHSKRTQSCPASTKMMIRSTILSFSSLGSYFTLRSAPNTVAKACHQKARNLPLNC